MNGMVKAVIFICAFVIPALAVSPRLANAQAGCSISVQKDTIPPVDMDFNFEVDSTTDGHDEFSLPAGTHTNVFFVEGETDVISEIVPEGWELLDVTCETEGSGFNVFVDADKNVVATCVTNGFSLCTWTDKGPSNVPTLSEWGMIAAAFGLGIVGVYYAVRRRRALAG